MKISMIAAMANNRVIGLGNKMPWHLPADLQFFKRVTLGKPVVMGRNTFESIGRPLPGRLNVIITRNRNYFAEGITCVPSPEAALELLRDQAEIMVIGGATIYQQFLPRADQLFLTFIDLDTEGDTWFPDYQALGQWQELERQVCTADEKNPYNYQFVTLAR